MDVFIFQMGKVASTAIKDALQRHGIEAVQAHWLGRDTLNRSLNKKLLNVDIDEFKALRNLQGFAANIRDTRTLLWYQKYKQRDGEKLRIITLSRDPLARYWSHLAQNFDLYEREITNWYATVSGVDSERVDLYHAASVFYRHLFECLGNMKCAIDAPDFPPEVRQQRYQGIRTPFLSSQLMQIRWPTTWFDNVFRPNIGIDVYDSPERISAGVYRYENDYAEILLIRYEDLDSALEPLGRFLDLKETPSLRRANVTHSKPLPFDIKAFAEEHRPGSAALDKLYDCRYCRSFGYARYDSHPSNCRQ